MKNLEKGSSNIFLNYLNNTIKANIIIKKNIKITPKLINDFTKINKVNSISFL